MFHSMANIRCLLQLTPSVLFYVLLGKRVCEEGMVAERLKGTEGISGKRFPDKLHI